MPGMGPLIHSDAHPEHLCNRSVYLLDTFIVVFTTLDVLYY
jgi:hypothetical protein